MTKTLIWIVVSSLAVSFAWVRISHTSQPRATKPAAKVVPVQVEPPQAWTKAKVVDLSEEARTIAQRFTREHLKQEVTVTYLAEEPTATYPVLEHRFAFQGRGPEEGGPRLIFRGTVVLFPTGTWYLYSLESNYTSTRTGWFSHYSNDPYGIHEEGPYGTKTACFESVASSREYYRPLHLGDGSCIYKTVEILVLSDWVKQAP